MTEKEIIHQAIESYILEQLSLADIYEKDGAPFSAMDCMQRAKDAEALASDLDTKLEDIANPSWQQIETAPKDGTNILACDASTGKIVVVSHDDFVGEGYDWYDETTGGYWSECGLTHWMALPNLPASYNNAAIAKAEGAV